MKNQFTTHSTKSPVLPKYATKLYRHFLSLKEFKESKLKIICHFCIIYFSEYIYEIRINIAMKKICFSVLIFSQVFFFKSKAFSLFFSPKIIYMDNQKLSRVKSIYPRKYSYSLYCDSLTQGEF